MIVTHADSDFAPLCGETQPDSSGFLATSVTEADVDCRDCLEALGNPTALLNF